MNFEQFFRFSDEQIVYQIWAKQIILEARRDTLLILTEFFIYIINQKNNKDYSLLNSFSYMDLEDAAELDEYTFRISFKSKDTYAFVEEKKTLIIKKIQLILNEVAIKKEMPKITLLEPLPEKNYAFSDLTISRYKALMAWSNRYPIDTVIDTLRRFVQNYTKEINLGIIEDYGLDLNLFLKSMEVNPNYRSVVVPYRPGSGYFSLIMSNISSDSNITKITILDKIEDDFHQFINLLIHIPQLSFNKLVLKTLDLSAATTELLVEYLKDHVLTIKFIKCSFSESEKLVTTMMTMQNKLKGVYFESMWLDDSTDLVNATLSVPNVSLRSCGILANEMLTKIGRNSANQLVSMDLSYNKCKDDFATHLIFPDTFKRLELKNVEWTPSNLFLVINSVCSSNCQELLIDNVILSSAQWKQFWSNMKSDKIVSHNLLLLSWSNNQVRPQLLSIIENTQLEYLSFAGCSFKSNSASILCKFIEKSKSLKILDIHSAENQIDHKVIKSILNVVPKCRTLKRLDVTDNLLATHSGLYSVFMKAIINSELRQLHCDGQGIIDLKQFEEFTNEISKKKICRVRFPENDFQKICENSSLSPEKIQSIKEKYYNPHKIHKNLTGHKDWNKLVYYEYKFHNIDPPVKMDNSAPLSNDGKQIADAYAYRSTPVRAPSSFIGTRHNSLDVTSIPKPNFQQINSPANQAIITQSLSESEFPVIDKDDAPNPSFNLESRWKMDFVSLPEIENDKLLQTFDQDFELSNLIQRLKKM